MSDLIRTKDWSPSGLGPVATWPTTLRVAVGALLDCPLPTVLLWGDQLIQVYNDAYQPLLGDRHPAALGQPTQACWPEVWHFNEPIYRQVRHEGTCFHFKDQEFIIEPSGVREARYFTVTYAPSRDETGTTCGISVIAMETTAAVLTERANAALLAGLRTASARHAYQLQLSDSLRSLARADDIIDTANALLGRELAASRVMYAEADEAEGTFEVRRDWTRDGLFSMTGQVRRLADFGPEVVALLHGGGAMVVDDIALDPRTAAHAAAYAQIEVRANLAIPLVKAGRMIAILSLHSEQPRHWTDDDIAVARDTAERTWASVEAAMAQDNLRAERDRSQQIFDGMTEGMAVLDADWTVRRMNAEGLRIGQRLEADVIGRNHWHVWPETLGTPLEPFYRHVMESRTVEALEFQYVPPGSAPVWIEIRAYPVADGGLAVFFRDIDARKLIERRLQEGDRRKDEFLAMLAHELRNPLAPISAAAQLLRLVEPDPASLRRTSDIIVRQVQHMTNLVDDLLDVSRVSKGLVELERVPLNIQAVVTDAVEQANPLIVQRRHRLTLHLPPENAIVVGDKKRLVQVLTNLLINAAKYTNEGGNLSLRMEALADTVVLHVEDDGIGMTAELAERAFDLFSQADRTSDRSAGGMGLGLALVKALADLHGGSVTGFSRGMGLGSRFSVTLPRLPSDDAPYGTAPTSEELPLAGRAQRIMIVDDNPDAALTLAMLLEALGHSVIVEHSSLKALERARRERFDVCLLDVGLPEMDGNELALCLRQQPETAGALLIAITGYGQDRDREKSLTAGFDHHLVKPVDAARLLALLDRPARNP